MLHLKELVKNTDYIKEEFHINNITAILNILKNKSDFIKKVSKEYIFSDGAIKDSYFLKLIEKCQFGEYIIEAREFIGTFIDYEELKIDTNSDYLFLYNDEITIMIPVIKTKNDHEEYYKIYIDKLICIQDYLLQKCDGCSSISLKQLLFKLYPEINTGLNKKYENYKGMVCAECLDKMEKGITLKNHEQTSEQSNRGDVNEKIDEFSSIEDILKFCGLNNKDELQNALKNKIYSDY